MLVGLSRPRFRRGERAHGGPGANLGDLAQHRHHPHRRVEDALRFAVRHRRIVGRGGGDAIGSSSSSSFIGTSATSTPPSDAKRPAHGPVALMMHSARTV